jgi:hypothetical protein
MNAVDLLQPIFDGGLERNNFFNGRLLSAEDLRAEQEASSRQAAQLARAVGDGVAWGLEATMLRAGPDRPAVRVAPGLALNRLGNRLQLSGPAEVTLSAEPRAPDQGAAVFGVCEELHAGGQLTGEGVYVLALAPSSGFSGSALVADPNTTEAGRGSCGARYRVEGVRFRLVPMEIPLLTGLDGTVRDRALGLVTSTSAQQRERLRNLLAHLCFGTGVHDEFFREPHRRVDGRPAWHRWGALDAMRARGTLTDCDVPLAIVVLLGSSIRLLDAWAARRRLWDAAAVEAWEWVATPRRVAEAEAAFLQFQAQLEGVRSAGSASSAQAATWFDVLPPAGWLPIGASGFNYTAFLQAHAPPAVTPVDAALLRAVVQRSWEMEPFLLSTLPAVPLRVYQVPGESFVVFARSEHGNIRVNLSPAPPAGATVSVRARSVTGLETRGAAPVGSVVTVPELDPGAHTLAIEVTGFSPATGFPTTVVGGRTVDVAVNLSALPDGQFEVSVRDHDTNADLGTVVSSVIATGVGVSRAGSYHAATGRWRITDLPAGGYTVTASAPRYQSTTRSGVQAQNAETTTVTLVIRRVPPPPRPSRCVVTSRQGMQLTLCMVLAAAEFEEAFHYGEGRDKVTQQIAKLLAAKRKQSGAKGRTRYVAGSGAIVFTEPLWKDMRPELQPPPQLTTWMRAWRDWLAEELEEPELLKREPVLYVDPGFTPARSLGEVRDLPAGFAVFGGFGIPVSIRLDEFRLEKDVSVTGNSFRGLEDKDIEALRRYEIRHLDDLPGLWKEIICDITGLTPIVASTLIIEATDKVIQLRENFGYYPGMDDQTAGSLRDRGYVDDVAIANGNLVELAEIVGSYAYAVRLQEQARGIVPREAWALDDLSLTLNDIESLQGRGVDSKGALIRTLGAENGRVLVRDALGLEETQATTLDALESGALKQVTLQTVARSGRDSVYTMEGMSGSLALALSREGYGSVERLAGASADEVASKIGIEEAAAEELVTMAQSRSRTSMSIDTMGGVGAAQQGSLRALVGENATVGDLLQMNAAALAPAFGGSDVKARAFMEGLQAGMNMYGR